MWFRALQVIELALLIYLYVSGDIVGDDILIRDIFRYGRYFAFCLFDFFWYYRFVSVIILISICIRVIVASILKLTLVSS